MVWGHEKYVCTSWLLPKGFKLPLLTLSLDSITLVSIRRLFRKMRDYIKASKSLTGVQIWWKLWSTNLTKRSINIYDSNCLLSTFFKNIFLFSCCVGCTISIYQAWLIYLIPCLRKLNILKLAKAWNWYFVS